MPFYATAFNLRSKVDLIWTRCIRPVKAQSVQFSKTAKKLNIDLCPFFYHWKEALFLLKSWNKKWGSPYSFLRQGGMRRKYPPHAWRVSKWHVCERGKKALKNLFFQNLHRDITGSSQESRTQQHAYCLRYAHFQHIESHLGKKQPQPKILLHACTSGAPYLRKSGNPSIREILVITWLYARPSIRTMGKQMWVSNL